LNRSAAKEDSSFGGRKMHCSLLCQSEASLVFSLFFATLAWNAPKSLSLSRPFRPLTCVRRTRTDRAACVQRCLHLLQTLNPSVGAKRPTRSLSIEIADAALRGRALRGCGLVLKNRKTAHQNRGFGVIFGIFYYVVWLRFWKCGCGTTAKTAVAYLTRVDAKITGEIAYFTGEIAYFTGEIAYTSGAIAYFTGVTAYFTGVTA